MKLTEDTVFEEGILQKLPLTYHFMMELKREENSEFKNSKRFSTSSKHQSSEYLSRATFKPSSSLFPNKK